jgi:hypothetical protein
MSVADIYDKVIPSGTLDEVRKRNAERDAEFREALLKAHGVENNPLSSRCYELAWEHGHSSGYSEVENYFNEFVDLIKGGNMKLVNKLSENPTMKVECSCKHVEEMDITEGIVEISGRPKTMSRKVCTKCGRTISVYVSIGIQEVDYRKRYVLDVNKMSKNVQVSTGSA